VYPVARGTAPAMLTIWAVVFLGERPSAVGIAGIGLILCGLVVLGGAPMLVGRGGERGWEAVRTHTRGTGPAFLVALLVSVYTAIDGAAVRHWTPIPYLVVVFALAGAALIPLLALRRGKHVFTVLRTHWLPAAVIAIMTLAAYSLVLNAFRIAPVSYAGAGREIGIVFAALAGWLFLGERFGGVRTVGAVTVFLGIGLLAAA